MSADVGRAKLDGFTDTQACRVADEEEDPMLEEACAGQQTSDLVSAQDVRELARPAGHRNLEVSLGAAECLVVEEAQRGARHVAAARRKFLMQMEQVALDLLIRYAVRGPFVVPGDSAW